MPSEEVTREELLESIRGTRNEAQLLRPWRPVDLLRYRTLRVAQAEHQALRDSMFPPVGNVIGTQVAAIILVLRATDIVQLDAALTGLDSALDRYLSMLLGCVGLVLGAVSLFVSFR